MADPPELKDLLRNEGSKEYYEFKLYLESILCAEQLSFYQEVETYRQLFDNDASLEVKHVQLKKICINHIESSAGTQINITSDIRTEILECYKTTRVHMTHIHRDIFEKARLSVLDDLYVHYMQYYQTYYGLYSPPTTPTSSKESSFSQRSDSSQAPVQSWSSTESNRLPGLFQPVHKLVNSIKSRFPRHPNDGR